MPGLRPPTPTKGVLDLTRRLAEEYDSVPLPEISRIVQAAAATTTGPNGGWNGTREGIAAVIGIIEALAREDLEARRSPGAAPTPEPTDRARPADRRSKRRRGVA